MPAVVIGLGNPVLTDDGVGIAAVRRLAREIEGRGDVDAIELYRGGLSLMEAMVGYDRAFIVDSIVTEGGKPGTIYSLSVADLPRTRNTYSSHDTQLAVALEFGTASGLRLPEEIKIWAVEAQDVETFSEELSAEVERALPLLVESLVQELGKDN